MFYTNVSLGNNMAFNDDIKRFNDKVEKAATMIFRGTALSLFSKVILRTPVGNTSIWKTKYPPKGYVGGRLRGNWQARINSAPSGEIDKPDKNGGDTINKAKNETFKAKLGNSIYLVNNLPYAGVIEDGLHSKQAPAGMVKVTIAEFRSVVNANARKHKA